MVAEVASKESSAKTRQEQTGALLFELETVGAEGRRLAFEVLKSLLQKEDIKLTEADYIRFGQHPMPKSMIHWVAVKWSLKNSVAEKLTADFAEQFAQKLLNSNGAIKGALAKLIQASQDKDMEVGVVSSFPEETATKIMEKLGLIEKGVKLFHFKGEYRHFPGADMWLKVAQQMNRAPKTCIVLASSGNASRSALSAGMKCVGLPDSYTQHQDFGGADGVYENWDEMNPKDVLSIIAADLK